MQDPKADIKVDKKLLLYVVEKQPVKIDYSKHCKFNHSDVQDSTLLSGGTVVLDNGMILRNATSDCCKKSNITKHIYRNRSSVDVENSEINNVESTEVVENDLLKSASDAHGLSEWGIASQVAAQITVKTEDDNVVTHDSDCSVTSKKPNDGITSEMPSCDPAEKYIEVQVSEEIPSAHVMASSLVLKAYEAYKCSECGKIVDTLSNLKAHRLNHIPRNSHECPQCGKGFITEQRMKRHKKLHAREAQKFTCPQCHKTFVHKKERDTHVATHSQEKPYECAVCKKHFKSDNLLKTHQAAHDAQKRLACKICGKTFAQQTGLYKHYAMHKGEKRFECKICGERFAQSISRNLHKRTHFEKQGTA